ADVDNPAALRFAKAMKRFPAAVKRARQVRADRAVPFFNGQFRCGTEYATAGIVHKNVQPLHRPVDILEPLSNRRAITYIGGMSEDFTVRVGLLKSFSGRLQWFRIPAADCHIRSMY